MVDLHIAPDEVAALAAMAIPFVVLRGVDLDHGSYAIFTGGYAGRRTRVSGPCILNRWHVTGKTVWVRVEDRL